MSLLVELSGNKAKARAAGKELTISQLENLLAGLNSALEILQNEEKERQELLKKKTEDAELITQMMAESGLTLEDIATFTSGQTRTNPAKGKTLAPKYRIEWNGETHEWTGRGRTPRVFAEYFEAGNSRESAMIDGGAEE